MNVVNLLFAEEQVVLDRNNSLQNQSHSLQESSRKVKSLKRHIVLSRLLFIEGTPELFCITPVIVLLIDRLKSCQRCNIMFTLLEGKNSFKLNFG